MCEKLNYCSRKIDPCIQEIVNTINESNDYKTLASCCGHNKYPSTIVIFNIKTEKVTDWFTGVKIADKKRKGNRYYRKDVEGYYFIPEALFANKIFRIELLRQIIYQNSLKRCKFCKKVLIDGHFCTIEEGKGDETIIHELCFNCSLLGYIAEGINK